MNRRRKDEAMSCSFSRQNFCPDKEGVVSFLWAKRAMPATPLFDPMERAGYQASISGA
jgi:hypothetical protein